MISLAVTYYFMLALGAIAGFFAAALLSARKIEDLEDEIVALKQKEKSTVSNRKRVTK